MTSLEKIAIRHGTLRLSQVVHIPVGGVVKGDGYEIGSEARRGLDWWKGKGSEFGKCVTSEAGMLMISHPFMVQSPLFCAGHIHQMPLGLGEPTAYE